MLQRNLLQYSNRLGNTQSAGILLRLAFADGEHLCLEQLDDISVEAISAAVNIPELGTISSISICTSTMRNLSPELMEGLSKSESLREIYLMQSPLRKADTPDVELLEALATRPHFFSRVKLTFAGSYSAALRKIFWLPTISKNTSTSASTIQTAPLSIFPIQQILISYQITRGTPYKTASVYLGDSLLTPERFAAGFLTYLHSSKSNFPVKEDFNSSARLFSFSSAPASLTSSSLSSVEISPIPAESFAIGDDNIPDDIRPKIRDLSPDGWTVLITSGKGWNPKASKQEAESSCGHVRYAIIRPRKQTIEVENPPSTPLGRDELEVVGLKEFLTITAPDVDLEPVDRRLGEIAECCEPGYRQGVMPGSITPVHVLKHEGAAEMLLACLRDARDLNENLRRAMKKNLGGEWPPGSMLPLNLVLIYLCSGQPWYPELLQTSSDTR